MSCDILTTSLALRQTAIADKPAAAAESSCYPARLIPLSQKDSSTHKSANFCFFAQERRQGRKPCCRSEFSRASEVAPSRQISNSTPARKILPKLIYVPFSNHSANATRVCPPGNCISLDVPPQGAAFRAANASFSRRFSAQPPRRPFTTTPTWHAARRCRNRRCII